MAEPSSTPNDTGFQSVIGFGFFSVAVVSIGLVIFTVLFCRYVAPAEFKSVWEPGGTHTDVSNEHARYILDAARMNDALEPDMQQLQAPPPAYTLRPHRCNDDMLDIGEIHADGYGDGEVPSLVCGHADGPASHDDHTARQHANQTNAFVTVVYLGAPPDYTHSDTNLPPNTSSESYAPAFRI